MNSISAATQLHQIVGDDLMEQICDAFGGQAIYIPQRIPDMTRDYRVCREFNDIIHTEPSVGSAYVKIGEKEGLSPRTVQRIIGGN